MPLLLTEPLLDLSPNARDGLDCRSLELGHLQARGEHALDEGGLLEHLVRLSGQLEFLDHPSRLVHLQNDPGGSDPEPRRDIRDGLDCEEAGALGSNWRPDVGVAVEVERSVLDHPVSEVVLGDAEDGQGLEAAPAQRHDQGVPVLQDLGVPTVLLQTDLDIADLILASLNENSRKN